MKNSRMNKRQEWYIEKKKQKRILMRFPTLIIFSALEQFQWKDYSCGLLMNLFERFFRVSEHEVLGEKHLKYQHF